MAVKIMVRVAGSNTLQELEIPEGIEVRDVIVDAPGMRVGISPQDKGWRSGNAHVSLFLNELEDREDAPYVSMTIGDVYRNPEDPEDMAWKFRADARLYASDKRIVAQNQTCNAKHKDYVIAPRPWKNPYAPHEDASQRPSAYADRLPDGTFGEH